MAIEYKIDRENRKITAILRDTMDDPASHILKNVDVEALCQISFGVYGLEPLEIRDEYFGVARCHPDDEWDEEIGKAIAKSRCLKKYYYDKDKAEMNWCLNVIETAHYCEELYKKLSINGNVNKLHRTKKFVPNLNNYYEVQYKIGLLEKRVADAKKNLLNAQDALDKLCN